MGVERRGKRGVLSNAFGAISLQPEFGSDGVRNLREQKTDDIRG